MIGRFQSQEPLLLKLPGKSPEHVLHIFSHQLLRTLSDKGVRRIGKHLVHQLLLRGDENDEALFPHAVDPFRHGKAIHFRHADIQKQNIKGGLFVRLKQSFSARIGFYFRFRKVMSAQLLQHCGELFQHRYIIVTDCNCYHPLSRHPFQISIRKSGPVRKAAGTNAPVQGRKADRSAKSPVPGRILVIHFFHI